MENRFSPDFRRTKDDGYIILTTHNDRARIKNEAELNSLPSKTVSYRAETEGDFPESAYPAEEQLLLKVGSQVMFTKNDAERIKRYFNGKIGIVTWLEEDKILIHCKDEAEEIEVKKEKWENIRYTVDKQSRQLNEEVLGSFSQYPLRLAWAITIHKSQGLTFEKVIIDAGEAFAPGQVYVALSRCTTLDGIVLQSHIKSTKMFSDERIVQFSKTNSSKKAIEQELQQSKRNYQLKILLSLFDYQQIIAEAEVLNQYLLENKSPFNEESEEWINGFLNEITKLQATAEKFQNQLRSIFNQEENPDTNELLKERMNAGSAYFLKEQSRLNESVTNCPVVTDSRLHAKEVNETLREIFSKLSIKKYLIENLTGEIDIEKYHKSKKDFILPPFGVNAYAGEAKQRTDSPHPVLHQRLRKLRDIICSKADIPIYIVAGTNTLDEMARYLPMNLTELRRISGFGDAKTEKYGQQFLDIIIEYCNEKSLSSLIHEKIPKREKKVTGGEKKNKINTKAESFRLYKEGKCVEEIAKERNLTQQTIEGHLAHYVSTGDINISELVSREKVLLIEPIAKTLSGKSLTPIKEKLGREISFGEIKLVIAWLGFKENQRPI
ncbi:MAG TPA: helix-turn-helix domain-containing protein [Chitinophagaceae bacterium]|nr:helix-turn-helix domain-containing protein [Chitinophagaceae bacterium]